MGRKERLLSGCSSALPIALEVFFDLSPFITSTLIFAIECCNYLKTYVIFDMEIALLYALSLG
jgi:hypothetical protein